MMKIGEYNELRVARDSDYGLYLADADGNEVLLPRRYVTPDMQAGETLRVFVYRDSEDRPVATTETPYARVGEFTYLQVSDVNAMGAFMDWGLEGKQLLVPFSEQRTRMVRGGIYLVYVYLDHTTGRVVGSAKTDRFLGNVIPRYRRGAEVEALVIEHTPLGYKVIVDNLHRGMIYENEIYAPLEVEQTVKAYVKHVRPDGKIDLNVGAGAMDRVGEIAPRIVTALQVAGGGRLELGDHSSPELIKELFQCSKKDFKRALGTLYRQGVIKINPDSIELVK